MPEQHSVYDLGEIDPKPRPAVKRRENRRPGVGKHPPYSPTFGPSAPGSPVAGTLSLFLPGTGQWVYGRVATGLCFTVWIGLVAALAWAVLATLDRLPDTLNLLGLPRGVAVWTLAALYAVAASLHLGSVLDAPSDSGAFVPPAVAGAASAVIPGWGQILNGHRGRAACFLAGLWIVGAAWLLVLPATTHLLDALGLYLPGVVRVFCSAPVRWTLPAVIWALAIYDAAASAASAR